MSSLWWSLPGPARYLDDVARGVRNGDNVVLPLPRHLPDGMFEALRATLGRSWQVDVLPAEAGPRPLDHLYDRYAPDSDPASARSARALAERADFRERVLWLSLESEEHRRRWEPVIEAYRSACHGSGRQGHAQFVVALCGEAAEPPPPRETLLAIRPLRGYVNGLDATLYAALLLNDRGLDHLPRQVAGATIASLALWDPTVADRFASEHDIDGALEHPLPLLLDLARERGWSSTDTPSWAAGQLDAPDGEVRLHSALCAARGDLAELTRRRWKGQVSVLFPYIDERRHELIGALQDHLTAPHTFERDGVTRVRRSIYEFEFTDIIEQLRTAGRAPAGAWEVAQSLRNLRNDLAHFEAISAERLRTPFHNQIKRLGRSY